MIRILRTSLSQCALTGRYRGFFHLPSVKGSFEPNSLQIFSPNKESRNSASSTKTNWSGKLSEKRVIFVRLVADSAEFLNVKARL